MLCPRCHGTHYVLANGQRLPCPECGGFGEVHCCDGLADQPDPAGDAVEPPKRANGAACPVVPPAAKMTGPG